MKRLYQNSIVISYWLLVISLTLYSYVLLDPNLTLINFSGWNAFRSAVIQVGFFQRELSAQLYVAILLLLWLFHSYFVGNYKKINIYWIVGGLVLVGLVSYPLLSHDFFNYMFDAKIVTFYHQNPYLHKALDFPDDPWIRFMHWTHRTYPYGPTFLLISLIPSFLSFGKFILSYFLFKVTFVVFYLGAVYYLKKIDMKKAIIFATHPLVILEGLVAMHNDLIAVCLVVIGVYYLAHKKNIAGYVAMMVSAGVKYITLPFIFYSVSDRRRQYIMAGMLGIILLYLSFKSEIQPWYFLALFGLIPFYEELINQMGIFLAGLLLSYYPYIRFGEWGAGGKVADKHFIIGVFFAINFIYIVVKKRKILQTHD